MLVGGDICKALLKQEIRFSVLVPRTSLWFVVGFVLFFFGGAQRFTRCFSRAVAVFMGKVIEMLNLPAVLRGRPATVTLAGAASTSEHGQEDACRGEERGCAGQALQRDVAAPRPLSHPARPCPSSWVLALVQAAPRPGSVAQQRRAVGLVLAT